MAVPMLADRLPFYVLDPKNLTVPPAEAAAKDVAARSARKVSVADMQPVDLVICGSVAVNREGVRLGKGAGYSDIELALLQEAGLIRRDTAIVTTVHRLQEAYRKLSLKK
jgi:5-formyltetrahydrofolate cyclo-ligase